MAGGRKFIISGGPGSGKSTLTAGLQQRGFSCSAEVSRRMIIEQVALGTDCLPWLDVSCFSVKVLQEMISEWNRMTVDEDTFFDRGIPDIIAYLKLAGLPVADLYYESLKLHPYATLVFILPPWKEIYVNDPERWQTYEEAVSINLAICEAYRSCGFELLEVPAMDVDQRVEFVISAVAAVS